MVKAFAAAAIVGAGLVWTTGATPRPAACTPKAWRSGGATYQQFCGAAHASLSYAGKTLEFTSGKCVVETVQGHPAFSINVGTVTLGRDVKPKYPYFGITVFNAAKDGVYRAAAITWQLPGVQESIARGTVQLQGNRSRGSFSGQLRSGKPGSGSFACR